MMNYMLAKIADRFSDGRDGRISGFVKLNAEDCAKIYRMMV